MRPSNQGLLKCNHAQISNIHLKAQKKNKEEKIILNFSACIKPLYCLRCIECGLYCVLYNV